jgi:hypothetical protein
MVVRTIFLWTLWAERNDAVFNNSIWPPNKLTHRIWSGLLDYGRVDWKRLQGQGHKNLGKLGELIRKFEKQWFANEVFAVMDWPEEGHQVAGVRWILGGPMEGFVFQVH